jgi:phosphocarrier protein
MTTIEPTGRTETQTVRVPNVLGLHARPAAEVVKIASQFTAEIFLAKEELEVNGKSIMGVMMLAAECGSELRVSATGEDGRDAVLAIVELVESGFGEELAP